MSVFLLSGVRFNSGSCLPQVKTTNFSNFMWVLGSHLHLPRQALSWNIRIWTLGKYSLNMNDFSAVNWWLLVPAQCQQQSPIWGVVKKETLFSTNSSVIMQHGCESALGPGPSWARQLSLDWSVLVYSASLCTCLSAPVWKASVLLFKIEF